MYEPTTAEMALEPALTGASDYDARFPPLPLRGKGKNPPAAYGELELGKWSGLLLIIALVLYLSVDDIVAWLSRRP